MLWESTDPSLLTQPPQQVTSCPWFNPLSSNQNKHALQPIAVSPTRMWTSVNIHLNRPLLQTQTGQENNFPFSYAVGVTNGHDFDCGN